jgi:hypothetical protein
MIFYTLRGPSHTLEIHDDKLHLTKKAWFRFLTKEPHKFAFEIDHLKNFEVTSPKFLFWGRLKWVTNEGQRGSFRFSTNGAMMGKIERYMQKRIEKNQQKNFGVKKMSDGSRPNHQIAA